MESRPEDSRPRWPVWVGLFVAFGSAATIALAIIESWAG
jgi:hypothetical protein